MKPPSQDLPTFDELRFRISGRGSDYTVEVMTSDGMTWSWSRQSLPLSDDDIRLCMASISQARHRWLSRSISPGSGDIIIEKGIQLFRWLVDSSFERTFHEIRNQSTRSMSGIRLRLQLEDPRLGSLPWEFLYDPIRQDFLALYQETPIFRQRGSEILPPIFPVPAPLRVLIVAGPASDPREVESVAGLFESFDSALVTHEIQSHEILRNSEEIGGAFGGEPFHIIHYVSAIEEPGVSAMRPPVKQDLMPDPIRAALDVDGVTGTLHGLPEMGLMFFLGDATQELALAASKILPAAVGISGSITREAARTFTEGFYRAVLAGSPLEAAVTQGRLAIDKRLPGGREWGLPSLYMQVEQAVLAHAPVDPAQEYRIEPVGVTSPGDEPIVLEADSDRALLSLQLKVLQQNQATIEQQQMRLGELPKRAIDQLNATRAEIEEIQSQLTGMDHGGA